MILAEFSTRLKVTKESRAATGSKAEKELKAATGLKAEKGSKIATAGLKGLMFFILCGAGLEAKAVEKVKVDATPQPPVSHKESQDSGSGIAYVSVHGILEKSLAFGTIRQDLDKKNKNYERSFAEAQRSLEKENGQLAALQSTMSEKAWAEKRKAFEKKVADFHKQVQNSQKKLEMLYGKAIARLQQAIQEILNQICQQEGYWMVLDIQNVVWLKPSTPNLTSRVLDALNREIKEIPLESDD